jgi:hypothetical protein
MRSLASVEANRIGCDMCLLLWLAIDASCDGVHPAVQMTTRTKEMRFPSAMACHFVWNALDWAREGTGQYAHNNY